MKAQDRSTNTSCGAGSSQSTCLRLVESNSQIMSVLTRTVALMLHFLVCPSLGTGIWNSKNQNVHLQPIIEMWNGDKEQFWWVRRADKLSYLS